MINKINKINDSERISELELIITVLKNRLTMREQELSELIKKNNSPLYKLLPELLTDELSVRDIFIFTDKKYKVSELREVLEALQTNKIIKEIDGKWKTIY